MKRNDPGRKSSAADGRGKGSGAAVHRGVVILLNILSAAAAVHLVFAASFMISEFRDARTSMFSASSLRYIVTDGRYGALAERYFDEGIAWKGTDSGMEEYAALAEYVNAAFRLRTYTVSGDSVPAERAKESMERAKERLSLLLPDTKMIDRIVLEGGGNDDQQ